MDRTSFSPLAPHDHQRYIVRVVLAKGVLKEQVMIDQPTSRPLIGVNVAIQAANDPSLVPRPRIFDEFSLQDRVGIVTGGNRGLGLEMALALCELGARAIYCFDLPSEPGQQWKDVQDYVKRMGTNSRLEYVSADVRDQKGMWDKVKAIGDKEGRMDVCVAAAGIAPKEFADCVSCSANVYQEASIKFHCGI
ncbi:hypothetical protein H0H92_011900 [Tricholoma furcatifolium]|nr:hypothetical protein H0H92_011900 [Tricholoma furcatifolium]